MVHDTCYGLKILVALGATLLGGCAAKLSSDSGIEVVPEAAEVKPRDTLPFVAYAAGAQVTLQVSWKVLETSGCGGISVDGLYSAPPSIPTGPCHVVATSQVDITKSATATVTVMDLAPPAAPSGLVAAATSSSGITLTWTNNATNQTGFRVERSSTSATVGFVQIATPGANNTSYNDAGLTPSTEYWYRIAAVNDAGDSAFSSVATATTQASGSGAVARPSYNTGTGFFTLNGKIYDANGQQFIPRGMNLVHYDASWPNCTTNCGIPNSGANTARWFDADFTDTAQNRLVMDMLRNNRIVSMPSCFYTPSAGDTTNTNTSSGALNACVTAWNNAYSTYKPYEKYMMLNVANEWGAGTDNTCAAGQTAWRNAYVSAVSSLRARGYLATLVIDCGGSGTDDNCITNHAQAIYDADPQHNIVFSWHEYGFTPTETRSIIQSLAAAQTATAGAYGGFPVIVGEFGPSGVYGGTTTALQVMQDAVSSGIGWLAWAWDDQTAPFNLMRTPPNGDFSLIQSGAAKGQPANCTPACTTSPCNCTQATDLSAYGNMVILSPTYGLFNAQPPKATMF